MGIYKINVDYRGIFFVIGAIFSYYYKLRSDAKLSIWRFSVLESSLGTYDATNGCVISTKRDIFRK